MKFLAIALALTFSTAFANPLVTKYYVCGTSKVAHIKKDCPALKKCKNKVTEVTSLKTGMTVCKFKSGCNGGGTSSQKASSSSSATKKTSNSSSTDKKTSSSSSTQKKTSSSSSSSSSTTKKK
ncbi:hypothetical protein [Flammeovirga sp. SJP92]|uniref:hypothetical protein n=1 Tax=Flammeovirga sp. SJP92 TaxID=1775430 RepID=UPI0007873EED|nr:hypothetical protein [Flammeovirga sp. SJP92]KXX72646.1 hypothetical protein AVL50_06495 [Flammeovirga sp. SJP92]